MSDLVEVRLLQVPVPLWQRATSHHDALRREFDIIEADLPRNSVPRQLAELIDSLDRQFGRAADPARQEMYAAVERGDDEATVVYMVPPEAADGARQLEEMMDQVDEFCRSGEELLTMATPPDLVAFRRWFLGEFVRQIEEGKAPTAWKGREADTTGDEPVGVSSAKGNGRVVRFDGDLDLATAGALRDELLDARKNHAESLVVDLSGVEFVDSVGLSLLVTTRNRLEEEGVEMRLILPEKLRLLFEISGLTEVLQPEFVGQGGGPAATGEGA